MTRALRKTWTDDEKAKLTELFGAGLTLDQVAERFPDRPKNGVRFKAYILGLLDRRKKETGPARIPVMEVGRTYPIQCPGDWANMGDMATQGGIIKPMVLVGISEGEHTNHYRFQHPVGKWETSFREQDLAEAVVAG